MSIETRKEEPELRFHPRYQYKYPEQVIMVSDNDLHFAVFTEGLIAASSVFADAFRFHQPPPHDEKSIDDPKKVALSKAIHIESNEVVLEWFINLLNSTLPICPLTDLDDTIALIELSEKYEVNNEIIKILKNRVEGLVDKYPWKWLALASKLDDRKMGVLALKKMGQEGFLNGDDPTENLTVGTEGFKSTFWQRMKTLSPEWIIPLLSMSFSSPTDAKFDNSTVGKFEDRFGNISEETKTGIYGSTTLKVLRGTWNWDERCEKFGRGEIPPQTIELFRLS